MGLWKAKINKKEEKFQDVRDKGFFLRREFIPVIVEFVKNNEHYEMVPESISSVVNPEGEDVSGFAHYAIIYRKKDGREVKLLFALMEDESSQVVGSNETKVDLETLLEDMFNPEELEKLSLYY